MGKGQRAREARAGQKEEKRKALAKKKLRSKIYKIITGTVAGLVAAALVAIIVFNLVSGTGFFLRNTVAMEAGDYKIDNAMMTYFIRNQYFNFVNNYGDPSNYGLDTEKSFASQQCALSEGTWLDFFLNEAKTQANNILLLANKAKANGVVLSDEDKKDIDDSIANFKSEAKEYNLTMSQYYGQVFGDGIKENDIRKAMELSTLASKYYEDYEAKIEINEDTYKKHFDENQSLYVKADYLTATIPGETEADIRTNAKIFQKAKNADEFKKLLEDYYKSLRTKEYVEDKNLEDASKLTDDQIKEINETVASDIENANATAYKPAADATDTKDFDKWLFESGRKANDIYTVETKADEEANTEFGLTVNLVVKPAYTDDTPLAKARSIQFTTEKYESDDAAKAKADEVLALYKAEATLDKFEALAKEYSADVTSAEEDTLYKNIDGNAISTWCYNSARKSGDVEVVKVDNGYSIMYYVGQGDAAWKAEAKTNILNERYTSHIEELSKEFTVTKLDDNMKKIKL